MIISDTIINKIITHKIGNKLQDEGYELSIETSELDEESEEYYLKYFLEVLRTDEKYRFTHPTDVDSNEVMNISLELFDGGDFIKLSQDIAKLLYAHSDHPKISAGVLNVVSFSNVAYSNNRCEAIGIFKSESDVPFLKLDQGNTKYALSHQTGYELNGLDKGALIIKTENDELEVITFNKNRAQGESKFWIDDFLQLEMISNDYYQTKEIMKVTKEFIQSTVPQEFEITRPDQIDLLNRSMDYLKNNNTYDQNEYLDSVLHDEGLKQSFRTFTGDHLMEMNIPESFPL